MVSVLQGFNGSTWLFGPSWTSLAILLVRRVPDFPVEALNPKP